MKRFVLTVAAVLIGAGSLSAQTADRRLSLSMEVRPVSSGGATRSKNSLHMHEGQKLPGYVQTRKNDFSSTRKRGSGVGLDVEVRNFSQLSAEAVVEWYFVGKPVTGQDLFVFDQGSKALTIASGSREIIGAESSELTSTVKKHLTLRSGYAGGFQNNLPSASVKKSGSKVAGWIVRLIAGSQVLQVRASSPSLETTGRNESQLRLLPRKQAKAD